MAFAETFQDGRLIKGRAIGDYKAFRYRIFGEKIFFDKTLYIHELVAEYLARING